MSESYEAAVEIRDAITAATDRLEALAPLDEQLEELSTLAERVDAPTATTTRIVTALEQLVRQHHAQARAAHGSAYQAVLAELYGDDPGAA